MNAPPRIVLDTNLLLVQPWEQQSIPMAVRCPAAGAFRLVISTPILLEYEEVLARKTSAEVAQNVVHLLSILPNVERVEPVYRWRLIIADPDDNKFVDAALQSGADAIVTHDRHFDALAELDFPRLSVWRAEQLQEALST